MPMTMSSARCKKMLTSTSLPSNSRPGIHCSRGIIDSSRPMRTRPDSRISSSVAALMIRLRSSARLWLSTRELDMAGTSLSKLTGNILQRFDSIVTKVKSEVNSPEKKVSRHEKLESMATQKGRPRPGEGADGLFADREKLMPQRWPRSRRARPWAGPSPPRSCGQAWR